ncbi:3-oxoacyl-(acyl-carrier-protein) synthase III [Cryptobacterium curtum DSM 15641]|uniref:3-oxoacyl-(Acyl-carrier-protein) synthase III n=1 Tax=Cryptobacterium curtum (strain ATCC 700683 / DSM 15641 / CCUG 43107 / 12-3) TaxID=469378 RepID=C7MPG8_CRYCD|nr:beta-ketoacyl-ACP synthase 3 [Cryptobacterium curtum]ACU94808.1 3-oxoacyl-(acyl-carrier-protein) synthase III [Cryptobacterium curtum DSM 15641]
MGCTVIGSGRAVPALRVTNDDMSHIVDTDDEWISQRTGIKSRRIALSETATDLGEAAARRAMGEGNSNGNGSSDSSGWTLQHTDPRTIDLIICMTITPDTTIPSQAALLKERLGAMHAIAFDLNAACSGCTYGITVAQSMMLASTITPGTSNPIRRALVIGVERLSRIVNWTDRSTCVLFGDGAGAVMLEWNEQKRGVRSSFLKNTDDVDRTLNRASMFDLSTFPFGTGPAVDPPLNTSTSQHNPFITMEGQKVFKFATAAIIEAIEAVLERAGVSLDEVSCIVPHQANERIIRYAARKLNVAEDLFQISIAETANTSAASALMALADAYQAGRIHTGDTVIMVGFGGGLTSGAVLFEA